MLPRQRLRLRLSLIRVLFATVVLVSFVAIVLTSSSGSRDRISHLELIDALLDQALHLSLSISPRAHLAGSPPTASRQPSSSAVNSEDALRAHVCQILQGRTILLVGPHDILYQLPSFLLRILLRSPGPGPMVPKAGASSCPGPSSCPFHLLCRRPPATISDSPTSSDAGTTTPSKND